MKRNKRRGVLKFGFIIRQYVKMFTQTVILPFWYWLYRRKRIDERLVVFADAHNHELPYSMKLLHEKFLSEGYRVEQVISDYGRDSFFVTMKHMLRFMKLYAQAGYVIICDYFLPVSAPRKKEGTKVIQLWHACGIFKRFGYEAEDDIPSFYKCPVIRNYNLVTVSSEKCVPVYARAMRLGNGIVQAVGISRTDIYFQKDYIEKCREKLYRMYPEAKGKKIILWAPTFRGNAAMPYLEGAGAIEKMKRELPKDWYVLVRLHPHFHDRDLNCEIPTEELLPVVDLLIADYSTVIFEYSLFEKPLVLFVPDFDTYGSKRGFYISYEELPGRIVTDEKKLAESILEEYTSFDKKRMRAFREKYMEACDGKATDRIYNRLIQR